MAQSSFTQTLEKLETTLDEYFGKKAPQLPDNIREVIVKIAPYLVILSLLFTVPAILALLSFGGMFTVMAPFGGMHMRGFSGNLWLSTIILIPVVVLNFMALPGLFAQKMQGWKYIFQAQLISLATAILQLNIVGFVVGGAISMYILFQVKKFYK